MNRVVSLSIYFVFSLCILGAGKPSIDVDNTRSHLDTYSKVNRTHHDNIDDTPQKHTHSHKHSEDGDEHEHSKVAQHEVKVLNQISYIQVTAREIGTPQGFFEKHIISSPHLLRLFKPPIA